MIILLGVILILFVFNSNKENFIIEEYSCNYNPLHRVYPWWHNSFSFGGFYVGPWTWNRQQHYYHPGVGWYVSPFSF